MIPRSQIYHLFGIRECKLVHIHHITCSFGQYLRNRRTGIGRIRLSRSSRGSRLVESGLHDVHGVLHGVVVSEGVQ